MNPNNNQPTKTQVIEITRKRLKIEPQVPSIRTAILGQWLNDVSVSRLADRYGCGEAFILAVCRSEARKMRDERRLAA